jgi:kumamolisin
MSTFQSRIAIPGTPPEPLPGSQPAEGEPNPEERITATVVVRSRAGDDEIAADLAALAKQSPHERPVLSFTEHEQRYGSTAEDLQAVQTFAAGYGLTVLEVSAARRVVDLAGSLAAFGRAFGVHFRLFDSPRGPYRTYDSPVLIPLQLVPVIEAVIGLDDRPLLRPQAAACEEPEKLVYVDPRTIAAYYQFPPGATGTGQCIAAVQFGGGYYQSDLEAYFNLRGLAMPEIALVELLGQSNQPATQPEIVQCAECFGILPSGTGSPANPQQALQYLMTIECTMDLELLGTLAPGARLVTYLAPGNPQGLYAAFSKAVFDPVNAPSVINCSWGSPESHFPRYLVLSLDKLFQQAALRNVTICTSSGDFGNGVAQYGSPTPQFPASSPHVLACGGSSISPDLSQETSWYETFPGRPGAASGGYGFSQIFPIPPWQEQAGISSTNRAYPDVAAKADILDGYDVVVTGLDLPMGGTSAAAPMWAALAALLNEQLKRPVGLLAPDLYTKPFAQAVHNITQSGGGPCVPTPGWNSCTGLGSPLGTGLLAALTSGPQGPGSG